MIQFEKFKKKDIPVVSSWIKSQAQLMQWAGPIFSWPFTQKQFRKHLLAASAQPPTLYPFGFYRGDKLIGYCELSNYNRGSSSATLSRVIVSPKLRNKGIGQKMLTGAMYYGFQKLQLNRIGLAVFDFNTSAINCYKKLGFILEGTLRQSIKVGSSYSNCHLMSVLQKEWQK